jgi:murein DD-endopeptidase MepM/ murein hydrolase activator NlpD
MASVGVWVGNEPVALSSGDTERISFVLGTYLYPDTLAPNLDFGLSEVALDGQATGGSTAENAVRTESKEHIVQSGETLSGIANLYDLSSNTLVVANPVLATNKHMIKPGQTLSIPVAEASEAEVSKVIAKVEKEAAAKAKASTASKAKTSASDKKALASALTTKGSGTTSAQNFKMPLSYKTVSQYFGGRHTGVDLTAPVGTPIYATADGCFIHVARGGWNGGYGNVSIQQIGSGMSALYAHQADQYVKTGDCVSKGEMIGRVGMTGKTTGPHLHFEIRINGSATNPLKYL